MRMGKHVYCQKPLTQTIYEARLLRDLAKKHKVATQMGNQGSAEDGLRRAVEVIQGGVIGPVRKVYVWSNRPIWPQGMDRPEGRTDSGDAGLGRVAGAGADASFQGPVADRRPRGGDAGAGPFTNPLPGAVAGFWHRRARDMACHTANMPFRALKLGYPTEIEATSSPINTESYPLKSTIRFEFPAREGLPRCNSGGMMAATPNPTSPSSTTAATSRRRRCWRTSRS